MGDGTFGLTEAVAIALGGMIGGGIYAVLGVVTQIAGAATWVGFGLAAVVAAGAGYSYAALARLDDSNRGGSVSFVQCFVGDSTLAGMTGWTLLVGYIGSMAMYAFAFGEFTAAIDGVPASLGGVPLRPVVSLVAVGGFLGLNLLGARATGVAEAALVAAKVAVLLALGVGGVAYIAVGSPAPLALGTSSIASLDPVMAAAVSFVAFQGWQLLYYDQDRIVEAETTVPRAVYLAIAVAATVYVLVAVATFNLAPTALQRQPHTALTEAARTLLAGAGLGGFGALVISLSAIASTGSAINATLFSSGHFAKRLLSNDLLPDQLADADEEGLPRRSLLTIAAVTGALAVAGSLAAITAFASLAFILVFGGVCAIAFVHRDQPGVNAVPPAVGVVGSGGFFVLLLWHLLRAEPRTFWAVFGLAAAVVAVELLYFERDVLEREVVRFEPDVGQ